jgi:23S rRNA pseudoU1915 N3-methylase RlmH
LLAAEAPRIAAYKGARMIALDEHGQPWFKTLADRLAEIARRNRYRSSAVPMGCQRSNAERADAASRVRNPAALARIVLAEQLYRAASLAQATLIIE